MKTSNLRLLPNSRLGHLTYGQAISALQQLGKAVRKNNYLSDKFVDDLKNLDQINRINLVKFKLIREELTNSEIVDLIYGITFLEAKYKWVGGSAASSIFLFNLLVERGVEMEVLDEVSRWVVLTTHNYYSPFGTISTHGASCYSEFIERRAKRANAVTSANRKIEDAANEEKELRKKRKEIGLEHRRGQARIDIIKKLNSLNLEEQLNYIAHDPTYPPNFYPTKIARTADIEQIRSLPEEIRIELARKMKGKHRGPWGVFKKKLLSTLGPIWDKKPVQENKA